MKHIVIDFEMNNVSQDSEARAICGMEIIEIGAVKLNEDLNEISSFRTYVKPEYNDIITKRINKLTGITMELVAEAPRFNEAFRMFTNWCLDVDAEVRLYAWSDNDYNQFTNEMILKSVTPTIEEECLLKEPWSNFQDEFDRDLGFKKNLSLKTALYMAGIDSIGREHDALDDARNTALLLRVFQNKNLYESTLRRIKEAMNPTPLGNTLGSIFDFTSLKNDLG